MAVPPLRDGLSPLTY